MEKRESTLWTEVAREEIEAFRGAWSARAAALGRHRVLVNRILTAERRLAALSTGAPAQGRGEYGRLRAELRDARAAEEVAAAEADRAEVALGEAWKGLKQAAAKAMRKTAPALRDAVAELYRDVLPVVEESCRLRDRWLRLRAAVETYRNAPRFDAALAGYAGVALDSPLTTMGDLERFRIFSPLSPAEVDVAQGQAVPWVCPVCASCYRPGVEDLAIRNHLPGCGLPETEEILRPGGEGPIPSPADLGL